MRILILGGGFTATSVQEWLPETVRWWAESGLTSGGWERRPLEIAAIRRELSQT